MSDPFAALPKGHYGAILADPPWQFKTLWGTASGPGNRNADYPTMDVDEISALPVKELAAPDCVLFTWAIWILMPKAFEAIEAWGFEYKTCAFDWMKAHAGQIEMFRDDGDVQMGLGYWTRANSEPCLLATRGKPKRLNADVRQGIIAPRREHSRKPDCVHGRIERLVSGPYLELFARQRRPGWDCWGNETDKFAAPAPRHPSWDEMWAKPLAETNPDCEGVP
jgi:N6-adenosine-specific RNA methylase IME4